MKTKNLKNSADGKRPTGAPPKAVPHASLRELQSAAQVLADYFAEFIDDAAKAPLSWRERAAINAYFDEIVDICDEVRLVMNNAKSWSPE